MTTHAQMKCSLGVSTDLISCYLHEGRAANNSVRIHLSRDKMLRNIMDFGFG